MPLVDHLMSLRTVDAAVSDSLQRVGLAVVAGLLGSALLWAIERWAGDWARPGQLRKQFRAVPAALAAAFKPGQVRAHAVLLLWLPWPAGGSLRQEGQAACALPGLSRYCCRDKKRGALPAALRRCCCPTMSWRTAPQCCQRWLRWRPSR